MRERRRRQTSSTRAAVLAVAAGWLFWAAPVGAAPVPGASYVGTHAGGGAVRFTVAADGSALTSYRVDDVAGDTCRFLAAGEAGIWQGTPIASDVFGYDLDGAFFLAGAFPEAQSATGTLRFSNPAVAGVKPACDSGVIAWTATTQATPPPPGSPAPASTNAAPRPSSALRRYRTTFLLRKPGRARLQGRLRSLGAGCAARRRVTLKRGPRTVASATSKPDGTFSFRRTSSMRGVAVRFSVTQRRGATLVCGSATSRSLRLPKRS